jgi:hypothetical protein
MARMSVWLTNNGHNVIVIVKSGGPAESLFSNKVLVVRMGELFDDLKSGLLWQSPNSNRNLACLPALDLIYAFSSDSLWLAANLKADLGSNATLLAGAYNPWEYATTNPFLRIKSPGCEIFRRLLPPAARLFMSEAVKSSIEARCGESIEGMIWPLPVDGDRYRSSKHAPERGTLVSIGTLCDFKSYNLYMLDVIRGLLDRGIEVRWSVYGEGPLREKMERRISDLNLHQHVRLEGALSYDDMAQVLCKAWVFIGMGTSLVEAGFCSVPSIPAIANTAKPLSYGYLYDLPGYAVGEELSLPLVSIDGLLERLLNLDAREYKAEEERTLAHVRRFDMEPIMQRFVKIGNDSSVQMRQANLCRVSMFTAFSNKCYISLRRCADKL